MSNKREPETIDELIGALSMHALSVPLGGTAAIVFSNRTSLLWLALAKDYARLRKLEASLKKSPGRPQAKNPTPAALAKRAQRAKKKPSA